jgi:pyruvate/2-oxoglutarate dehydrogenase complex dihydrolipoamide acyltransferase (E2) component
MIHSLAEVDVTEARRQLRRIRKERGEALSFTAFMISCCARAVESNPMVHAYRNLRNRLIIFEAVDTSVPTERVVDGLNQVVPILIRSANRKSIEQIHREIRTAQETPVKRAGVFASIRLYLLIPAFLRRMVFTLLDRNPRAMKKMAGTMMVSSVGMLGSGAGWGIPVASHTLNVTVGATVRRTELRGGEAREREYVCLTFSFDHDIVDGAPAARYVRRVRKIVEDAGADLRSL